MLNIAFGQSKNYVDNLSENIKIGIRQKLRNGIWPAWTPLGYMNDKNNRCITVDKKKVRLIRKSFEIYFIGDYSIAEIRKIINEAGLVQNSYQNPKSDKLAERAGFEPAVRSPVQRLSRAPP